MILIAKNYKGEVISIISAESVKSANAYWQGKHITPHIVDQWDMEKVRENEQEGYVTPILETQELDLKSWTMHDYKKFIIVK